MKRLSKKLYLGATIGGMIGSLIFVLLSIMFILYILSLAGVLPSYFNNLSGLGVQTLAIGILLAFLCLAAMIFGLVMYYILLYRACETIYAYLAPTGSHLPY